MRVVDNEGRSGYCLDCNAPTKHPGLTHQEAAETAKQQGINNAQQGARTSWLTAMWAIAQSVALRSREFTTDQLWNEFDKLTVKPTTPDGRAMGALMRDLLKDGIARPTNRTEPSMRIVCHKRPLRIWESLIYVRTTP